MDNTFQDPDDPTAISEIEEIMEKEVPVENLAPDELSLEVGGSINTFFEKTIV